MAEAGVLEMFSEQELTCSICLDLFNDPVSTPCGHNFCQGCIGGYFASSCTCPLCKHQFPERPQLNINRVFAHIAEKYKEARYGTGKLHASDVKTPGAMANSNPFLEEMIKCDVCTGKKQVAISSCLTCTASYCEAHVQPHLNTPFYVNHHLLEPREALRGRTCPLHHRLLEVYCRTDQICICAICVLEEHRTHRTVSVQTERVSEQVRRQSSFHIRLLEHTPIQNVSGPRSSKMLFVPRLQSEGYLRVWCVFGGVGRVSF